jgi:hypothetical protein
VHGHLALLAYEQSGQRVVAEEITADAFADTNTVEAQGAEPDSYSVAAVSASSGATDDLGGGF